MKILWQPALIFAIIVSVLRLFIFTLVYFQFYELAQTLALVDLPLMIAGIVFMSILIYQTWKALDIKYRCTTPSKAVGFGFIPFFNLYWVFVMYRGLAKGFTESLMDHNLIPSEDLLSLATWIACSMVIITILSLFYPLLSSILFIGVLILGIIFFKGIIQAIRAIESNRVQLPSSTQ